MTRKWMGEDEDKGIPYAAAEEETRDNTPKEKRPENGHRRQPTRKPPQDDREGERDVQKPPRSRRSMAQPGM
ncbi:hypothetical protein NDU88_002910 [Pleurodeles waltl]|uniref:Uncharacterized protein n=1 Tax=Pleurodeles waltl TaxID=8319 RepID=A0AAV7TMJ5_PLEWA|nr:hypothetical protein NDU88_002910 [Pleurodeles waltl]